MRRRIITLCLAVLMGVVFARPAHALFGLGDIVLDPTNLAQNVLTAERTLAQINNQIRQLQNEADMLINQAENLKQLDYSSIEHLARILETIETLMRRAVEITYEAEQSERAYQERYPESYEDLTNSEIVESALDQWTLSRRAFQDSIVVQSGIVTAISDTRGTLAELVGESQSATGNLTVSQAGNQLIALSVEQQMQMQQLMAAQYRADMLERARRIAIEEQSRVLHDRFRGAGSAYTRN